MSHTVHVFMIGSAFIVALLTLHDRLFPKFDPLNHLVSGGNDGKIILWTLLGSSSPRSGIASTNGSTTGHNRKTRRKQKNSQNSPRNRQQQQQQQQHATYNAKKETEIEHSSKVNWLSSGGHDGIILFVADQTSLITLYHMR